MKTPWFRSLNTYDHPRIAIANARIDGGGTLVGNKLSSESEAMSCETCEICVSP